MNEQAFPPPVSADPAPFAPQVAATEPAPRPTTRSALGWVIAALAGLLASAGGAFLTVVNIGDRAIKVDDFGVGVLIPWSVHDQSLVISLFERWDIALALLLGAAVAAVVLLAGPTLRWPAAVGAVLAAVAFHLQLSIVERAELRAIERLDTPSYAIGAVLMVGGAFLALVSFVVVLLRRP